jgi:hypothetical protein
MRPMSRATHGYLMTAAAISPTYVDQPCAITRTGRDRRLQPDFNFRRQFCVFSHFTNLSHPLPLMHDTLVSSLRDSIFALPQLLAELQCP